MNSPETRRNELHHAPPTIHDALKASIGMRADFIRRFRINALAAARLWSVNDAQLQFPSSSLRLFLFVRNTRLPGPEPIQGRLLGYSRNGVIRFPRRRRMNI